MIKNEKHLIKNSKVIYTSAWTEAAFLAWGGRYAAGFCAGELVDEDFVEVWEDFGPLAGQKALSVYKHKKKSNYRMFWMSKQQEEPCGLVSSTFNDSIDFTRSAISPNLSGDSGFQSACENIWHKILKDDKSKWNQRPKQRKDHENTDLIQFVKHLLEIQQSVVVENFNPSKRIEALSISKYNYLRPEQFSSNPEEAPLLTCIDHYHNMGED